MISEISRKLKRIFFSAITIRIGVAAVAFLSGVVINRSIGIEQKGSYSSILSFSNYIQMIMGLGICFSYSRMISKYGEKDGKDTVITLIWTQTLLFLVLFLAFSFVFPMDKTTIYVLVLSILIICNSQISFISVIDEIKKRNIIVLICSIIGLGFNLVCFFGFWGNLDAVVIFLIIKYIIETLFLAYSNEYFIFCFKCLTKEKVFYVLKLGIPTALMNLLITCNYNIDIIMLNCFKSEKIQIGIYGVAYSLSNMLWIVPDAFKELVYNKTAKGVNPKHVLECIKINILICTILCLGFNVFGKLFLKIVYGEEYIVAYQVTFLLFCGVIPMVAYKLIHPIYVNEGKTLSVAMLLIVAVTFNIIASYILIPTHGALGAAIASVVSYSVCGVLFFLRFYIEYYKRV